MYLTNNINKHFTEDLHTEYNAFLKMNMNNDSFIDYYCKKNNIEIHNEFEDLEYEIKFNIIDHGLTELELLIQLENIIKRRAKDFFIDSSDGSVYAIAMTICNNDKNIYQHQLEVEYTGSIFSKNKTVIR